MRARAHACLRLSVCMPAYVLARGRSHAACGASGWAVCMPASMQWSGLVPNQRAFRRVMSVTPVDFRYTCCRLNRGSVSTRECPTVPPMSQSRPIDEPAAPSAPSQLYLQPLGRPIIAGCGYGRPTAPAMADAHAYLRARTVPSVSCSARTQALKRLQPMSVGLQEGDVSVCTASGGKSVAVGCEWRSTVVSRHRK